MRSLSTEGRFRILSVALLLATINANAPADDVGETGWPFIRGPSYDGSSAEVELADSWPEAGPPVLWTLPLGQGYSAFVAPLLGHYLNRRLPSWK